MAFALPFGIDPFLLGWVIAIGGILFLFRKNVEIQFPLVLLKSPALANFVYERTKKWGRIIRPLSDIGIVLGFFGMAFVVYFLASSLWKIFFVPAAPATVSLIIPGVRIPGSSVFLPFTYGIISITILALVHEFAHAIVASVEGVKPKSIAFALLLFVPAAGVEIDEKKVAKKSLRTRLRIYSAGSFSNLLFALLILALSVGLSFAARPLVSLEGIEVTSVDNSSEAFGVIPAGTVVYSINGTDVKTIDKFLQVATSLKPSEFVEIGTDRGNYLIKTIPRSDNSSLGRIGITTKQKIKTNWLGNLLIWVLGLFQWLFNLNIGVAIINLFPFPIMDGGRMIQDTIGKFFKPDLAKKLVSVLFWAMAPLLGLNILVPIIKSIFFK